MASQVGIDKLPPTRDALKQHCLRSLYQFIIWDHALNPIIEMPNPLEYGWRVNEHETYSPVWTNRAPMPTLTPEMSFCYCKTGKSIANRLNYVF